MSATSVPGALYERQEAMAMVAAEAERARSGSGGLVLLKGTTGSGRTALLEAVGEQAAAHGMWVLRARCSSGPVTPFAAVKQLFDDGPELACPTAEPPDEADSTAAIHRERAAWLWRALLEWTEEAPLFLAVDDVQLADPLSRGWLVEAARLVERLPVLLVATERSQYDVEPPAPGLAHALPPRLVRTHTLTPLSPGGAAELVRSVAGAVASPAWVDDVVRAGAGNPLLLHALLDDLGAQAPGLAAAPAVPDTCAALYPGAYPAAVSWWLESAGSSTVDVARALAVVSDGRGGGHGGGRDRDGGGDRGEDRHPEAHEDGHAGLLADMTGADGARAHGWLTAMTRLGLLRPDPDGRPGYAHPLLRDAVVSGWSGDRRKAAHGRAAEVMLRRGAGAEAVAGQLLRAPAPFGTWAADVLLDAAARAVGAGRTEDAAGFLRRVLDEEMAPARRAAVLSELGSLEFTGGRSAAGLPRLAEAVQVADTPTDRVRSAMVLGTALAGRGEVRAAVGVLRSLEEQLTDHRDLARTLWSASALLSDHDQALRREVYGRLRETSARSPGLVGTAGQALLARYEATAGLLSARAAMERVRALLEAPADPLAETILLGTSAAVALWADELDEAERLAERALAGQRTVLLHPMRAELLNVRADLAAVRGGYATWLAEPDVRQVLQAVGDVRPPMSEAAAAVLALVETGRTEQAAALAERSDPRDAPDSGELPRFLYARGHLRAACGDPAGALDDFLECGRRQAERDVVGPVVTPWRSAAAECRLALGRPEEALALTHEELRLATVWNTPRLVGRCLRVLGTATGGLRGLGLAEEAVRLLRDTPAETELIPALIAQGRQLVAAGDRARARDPLREAAERAERIGAVRLRAAAEHVLREGGARRAATPYTGPAALTGSERRIAELAAGGRTNSEIGELLHLARRTVETHLTNAYRKLGIRRRAELPAALDRLPVGGK
ncbi:AAA family ATPase [Streptomyces sp. NBC_01006]|uniref:AAA family ATPase n=1 Tax=Streptomyces sp. NBC_01006 TaxID=2903716 RepID=UPI003867C84F|nr:AAA family ATPase [Streptomyces sp. NBC_01006]